MSLYFHHPLFHLPYASFLHLTSVRQSLSRPCWLSAVLTWPSARNRLLLHSESCFLKINYLSWAPLPLRAISHWIFPSRLPWQAKICSLEEYLSNPATLLLLTHSEYTLSNSPVFTSAKSAISFHSSGQLWDQ